MSNNPIISFCGDTCSVCPRYIATKDNNIEQLSELAKLWFHLGFRKEIVSPEEMKCHGCSRNKDCTHQINSCPYNSNINNCGECSQYPCKKINKVFERTDHLNRICKDKCSADKYIELDRAFLSKKKTLDRINFMTFRKN